MKVGIIGAGNIAQAAHVPGYQKQPGVEVVAITDIIPARAKDLATRFGIPKTFTDYHEMLKLPLDAISICVPNYVHAEAAIAALEAGKNVLCEKPMAMSAADGEKMVAAAKASGKILMMAFNNRFRADTIALKKLIDAGSFGDVYFARSGWIRRRGIPGWGSWFTRKNMSGGGALIDIGVHALDLTMWLMGKPEPVLVTGSCYSKFGSTPSDGTGSWGKKELDGVYDVDDLSCAMIKFANGATLMLEASWASHIDRDELFINVMGTKSGVSIAGEPTQMKIFTEAAGMLQDSVMQLAEAPTGNAYATEIAEFVSCIKDSRQPSSTGEDGVRVMRILDAIYKSAKTGAAVKL